MSREKTRQSGLELLRIIAMLLIIAHHYSIHGKYTPLTIENMTLARVFLQFLLIFGRPACSLFVLISGFFLIQADDFRKHYKKLGSFCGTILFYGIAYLILAGVFHIHITKRDFGSSILPFASFNWFIAYYLALYILIPFINPWLRSMTRKRYTQFLAVLLLCWSILPSLRFVSSVFSGTWDFGAIGFFFVMYILGAYIRLHVYGKVHYNNRRNLIVALATTLLMMLTVVGIDILACVTKHVGFLGKVQTLKEYTFPLCVVWSVSVFLYFLNLKFKSAAVNRIGAATFAIYLIHDHPLARTLIWERISPNVNYVAFPYFHALIKVFAVFCICVAIELLRSATIGKWFDRWFAAAYDRAFEKLDARRLRKSAAIR